MSKGLVFEDEGYDLEVTRLNAQQRCINSRHTENSECKEVTFCFNKEIEYKPMCVTGSNLLEFSAEGFLVEIAEHVALYRCQNNRHTDNGECSENMTCLDHEH